MIGLNPLLSEAVFSIGVRVGDRQTAPQSLNPLLSEAVFSMMACG